MFEARSTQEIMQIVAAGGGITMNGAARSTQELMQIAAAGASKGSRVTFTSLAARSTQELMQIAAAGRGCVSFEP